MSKQVTLKGFVYEVDYGFSEKDYCLRYSEQAGDQYNVLVGPAAFTYTMPDDFDPRASRVTALQLEKLKLQAEFAKKLMEIEDDISKLICIESAV